jgi:hypothetical protein
MSRQELLASAAHIEPATAASNNTDNEESKRKSRARGRRPQAPPQQHHGDHHRHADRGGDDDDGDGGGDEPDTWVPDSQVCRELSLTKMSLWRYTRDPELDFPPAISVRGRNFRSRKLLERWKRKMLLRAIAQRAQTRAAAAAKRPRVERDQES